MQVTVDLGNLLEDLKSGLADGLKGTQEQILQDCNYYCLQDQGTLMGSGITAFGAKALEVSWNTPYAARRYYEPANVRRGVNPNARIHWAEEAADSFSEDWAQLIAKEASK